MGGCRQDPAGVIRLEPMTSQVPAAIGDNSRDCPEPGLPAGASGQSAALSSPAARTYVSPCLFLHPRPVSDARGKRRLSCREAVARLNCGDSRPPRQERAGAGLDDLGLPPRRLSTTLCC